MCETNCFYIIGEYIDTADDLKESITIYGPYKLAKKLHSLDIMDCNSFSMLSNLQALSNIHLASVVVDQLSQNIIQRKKHVAFLDFIQREPTLVFIYNKLYFLSK